MNSIRSHTKVTWISSLAITACFNTKHQLFHAQGKQLTHALLSDLAGTSELVFFRQMLQTALHINYNCISNKYYQPIPNKAWYIKIPHQLGTPDTWNKMECRINMQSCLFLRLLMIMVRDKVRILTPYIYSSFQNLPIYVRVETGISNKSKIFS